MSSFNLTVEQIYEGKRKSLFNGSSRMKLEEEYIKFIELRKQLHQDLEQIKGRMLELK